MAVADICELEEQISFRAIDLVLPADTSLPVVAGQWRRNGLGTIMARYERWQLEIALLLAEVWGRVRREQTKEQNDLFTAIELSGAS